MPHNPHQRGLMMAKYNFLTFLGDNRYDETTYSYPDGSGKCKTRYVQVAILKYLLGKLQTHNLEVTVFVTPESRNANWDSVDGLHEKLKELIPETQIKAVDIENPETNRSHSFNWKLFDTITDHIPGSSTVILDITHAFRSIPTMAVTIINYARIVKNVELHAIFYGLYKRDNQESPIVDLTEADLLLRWSNAVSNFVDFGNANALKKLTKATSGNRQETIPHVKRLENAIADRLDTIWNLLATCRSSKIIEGDDFYNLQTDIMKLRDMDSYNLPTLHQLMDKITDSVLLFRENSNSNILAAIHLCIKYNLIQQGITLLNEGIITFILHAIGSNPDDRHLRDAVSAYFISEDKQQHGSRNSSNDNTIRIREKLDLNMNIVRVIKGGIYQPLKKIRNDINHGSYVPLPASDRDFAQKLKKIFGNTLLLIVQNARFFDDPALIEVARNLLDEYRDQEQPSVATIR